MLIWRGIGWLAAVLIGVGYASMDFLCGIFLHDHNYFANNLWPKLAGLWLAAFLIYILNLVLGRRARSNVETDPTTGLKFERRVTDHLFFVPLSWLPLILIAGSLLLGLFGRS